MKIMIAAVAAATLATTASAEIIRTQAQGTVEVAFQDLKNAVATAGANIFAEVPHSKGAASVDMELNDAMLLIFGNPRMGTPLMQQDMHAGLVLPLKMLVYADDEGQTWVAYEDVDAMLDGYGIDMDTPVIENMKMALDSFAQEAAD